MSIGSTSAVRVDGILSKEFLFTTGVFRGDTLAHFLFIIVLDFVLQKTEIATGLLTHPAKLLPDLDFADHIVLLDQDETQATEYLNINYDETKIMIRNIDNPRTELIEGKLIMKVAKNTALEIVNCFEYLGV